MLVSLLASNNLVGCVKTRHIRMVKKKSPLGFQAGIKGVYTIQVYTKVLRIKILT